MILTHAFNLSRRLPPCKRRMFYTGKQAIRPRAFPRRLPPAMNGGNQTAGKPGSAAAGPALGPKSFVRLFLTLGENTLDYLSRINK